MPLLQTQNQQPLTVSQGDVVTWYLLATNDQGIPVNLTGAILTTQIEGTNINGPYTIPSGEHTLGNQTTNPGTFSISLMAVDTESFGPGANKEILTEANISGAVTYYRGESLLSVYVNIPTQ